MEKNKLSLLIVFIVIYVLVIIGIIIYIWFVPKKVSDNVLSKYEVLTDEQAKQKFFTLYSQDIIPLFVAGYTDAIYDITDETFLKDNSLTKDNFKQYLQSNGYLVTNILNKEYVTSQNQNTITYTCKYNFNGIDKVINIIEKKPYDYKITFGNKVYDSNQSIETESNNILFKIQNVSSEINSVTYKITLTNKGEKKVTFKFESATDVKVNVEGKGVYPISGFTSMTGLNELGTGGSTSRTYTFDIPVSYQNLSKQMIFYNVNINGEVKNITVPM